MQKLSSQSIRDVKSESFISDDGLTVFVYVNGKQVKEIKLDSAWCLPSIEQSVIDGKLNLLVNNEVVYESSLWNLIIN